MVIDELSTVALPVIAVLGNHDLHSDMGDEIGQLLEAAGITVLDRSGTVVEVRGEHVGIAGAIGFGVFRRGNRLRLRRARDEELRGTGAPGGRWVGRRARRLGLPRIALTHYAPVAETLQGERREIYAFLGSHLLGDAIDSVGADLALHGHAHGGIECGTTPGGVPVRNVAMPVIRRPYCLFTIGG